MAKPLYVQAFEHFKDSNDDPLKAYVAFGLYIDAECKWAGSQSTWPTAAKYREWFECSFPHTTETHTERATDVLQAFANNIVDQERAEFLTAALDDFKAHVTESEKGFWRGVLEAATGAFCWMLFSFAMAYGLAFMGIDVLHGVSNFAHREAISAKPQTQDQLSQ